MSDGQIELEDVIGAIISCFMIFAILTGLQLHTLATLFLIIVIFGTALGLIISQDDFGPTQNNSTRGNSTRGYGSMRFDPVINYRKSTEYITIKQCCIQAKRLDLSNCVCGINLFNIALYTDELIYHVETSRFRYSSILARDVRECCFLTAKINDKYCSCGRALLYLDNPLFQ